MGSIQGLGMDPFCVTMRSACLVSSKEIMRDGMTYEKNMEEMDECMDDLFNAGYFLVFIFSEC